MDLVGSPGTLGFPRRSPDQVRTGVSGLRVRTARSGHQAGEPENTGLSV